MATEQLRDMFPDVHLRSLEAVLAQCDGDVQSAVHKILLSSAYHSQASCMRSALNSEAVGQAGMPVVPKSSCPCDGLSELQEMFPELNRKSLQQHLRECGGDVHATVEVLLQQRLGDSAGVPDQHLAMEELVFKRRRLEVKAPLSPVKEAQPHRRPPAKGGLLLPNEVSLPLAKVPVPLACSAPKARAFAFAAVKSKVCKQVGSFGPGVGNTWQWFIAAELVAKRQAASSGSKSHDMSVRILGDKFQAGWLKDADGTESAMTLRTRQLSMLQSCLHGTENKYGSQRRGVPVGFAHSWNYSDSTWTSRNAGEDHEAAEALWCTSEARWKEDKGSDRWHIDVSMLWSGVPADFPEGRHLLIADQRAEKLNPNQYATAMRGALVHTCNDDERAMSLQSMIDIYQCNGKQMGSAFYNGRNHFWTKRGPRGSTTDSSKDLEGASGADAPQTQ